MPRIQNRVGSPQPVNVNKRRYVDLRSKPHVGVIDIRAGEARPSAALGKGPPVGTAFVFYATEPAIERQCVHPDAQRTLYHFG